MTIFTVPNFLKALKRKSYVPERVSLGPYHHTSAELPLMNSHKGKALRRMMARFNNSRNLANTPNDMDFSNFARKAIQLMDFSNRAREEIVKLEEEIRDSYEEKIDCDGETLGRKLTLDGCFILEILRTLDG